MGEDRVVGPGWLSSPRVVKEEEFGRGHLSRGGKMPAWRRPKAVVGEGLLVELLDRRPEGYEERTHGEDLRMVAAHFDLSVNAVHEIWETGQARFSS